MALKFPQMPGFALFALGGVALAGTVSGIVADIATYQQTSRSAPPAPYGYNINLSGIFTTPNAYNSASFTYPGSGSPRSLSFTGSDGTAYAFAFASPRYPSLTALHKDYPYGSYMMTMTGPAGTVHSAIPYGSDDFNGTIPYVTNYSSLNGMNPASDFVVSYEPFTPNPATNGASTSVAIYNPGTGATVFNDTSSPDSTSAVIPANTLAPNTPYDFAINDINGVDGSDPADGTEPEQRFIRSTIVPFTTDGPAGPVPEPASLVLFGGGLLGLAVARRRAWRK